MWKGDQIQHLLMDCNLDFLGLIETLLNNNILRTMIDVPGCACYRKHRLLGKEGGVLISIRDILKCTKMSLETFDVKCLILNIVLLLKMNFKSVIQYNLSSYIVSIYHDSDELLNGTSEGQKLEQAIHQLDDQ